MKPWSDYAALLSFLGPALATAGATGIAGGVTGAFVILRREALLALALPQIVAASVALALAMHWPTLPTAIVIVASALILLAWVRQKMRADALIPCLYIAGLSTSVLLIVHSGQHLAELQNLFTGIDVAVAPAEAAIAVPLLLATIIPIALFWRRWLLVAQAPAAAQIAGVQLWRWQALFLALLALVVIVATAMQGIVLVLAMLFLPPTTALPWSRRLPQAMFLSGLMGFTCITLGFILSTELDWPLSHSAAAAGSALAAISLALRSLLPTKSKNPGEVIHESRAAKTDMR